MLIKAPAKINIGLKILRKREDGYHDIETIFYPVNLFDEIKIRITKSDSDKNSILMKSEKHSVPLIKNNTCIKTIENFFRIFRITDFYYIEIYLRKKIPIGGGLGGGSSDAGSIIRYLTKYFNIDVSRNRDKLMQCALSVGSDVPFFLLQKPCYATGRGENLRILNRFSLNYDILLVNPNRHISTKWAFEELNIDKDYVSPCILSGVEEFTPDNQELFANDFEKVVFNKYPDILEVKEELYSYGAVFASLSGSGAVLYGLFEKDKREKILSAHKSFSDKNYFVFTSRQDYV
ncbi:MAG: 4-(cytidine 5'-diphospho)-2-C-methyl-D-erythritol kinase [Ignavibacteria bacterium]|nr:4-(cytidine 5'-diphospho)-2-C-methyl-D-erythritol kinase [Ignavibacteria bacterium]